MTKRERRKFSLATLGQILQDCAVYDLKKALAAKDARIAELEQQLLTRDEQIARLKLTKLEMGKE